MNTPSLDNLFDFTRLRREREPEVDVAPTPAPAPVRRRIRDRDALRELRAVPSAPIDPRVSFDHARTQVRQRTSLALESLGVPAEAPVVEQPAPAPMIPQWRVLVRSAGKALEFYVPGADLVDAAKRATTAVADWMRENHRGAAWRVESVEDFAGCIL